MGHVLCFTARGGLGYTLSALEYANLRGITVFVHSLAAYAF